MLAGWFARYAALPIPSRVHMLSRSIQLVPLPRSAGVPQAAEDQAQIEGAHMHQLPLEDVVLLARLGTSHASRVVAVGKAAFHQLAAPSREALAAVAPHPHPVRVLRLLLSGLVLPVCVLAVAGLRFGS